MAQDLLAGVEDLKAVADGVDTADAETALARASAIVRGYCRQHLSRVTDDEVELVGTWEQRLVLPERPVSSVAEVRINDADVAYRRVRGVLWRRGAPAGGHWGGPASLVTVVYTHGFDTVPHDVAAVTVDVASRMVPGQVRRAGAVSQESIGDYSVTYRSSTSLTSAEQAVLDLYRRRVR